MLETTALQLFCRCFSSDRSHGSAQDIADGGQRSKSCELDGCLITRGYLRFSSTPHTPEPVLGDGTAAVSATMARRRTHRLFMAERPLKLLRDERSGGRGKAVSYATIHAMRSRAQLRRGATLTQESHERVRVPNCIRSALRTHSHNAHALP